MDIEYHPFEPFVPDHARVLFLGSFPPQRKRWCMEFFYPNWINDYWRILGLVFFGKKDHFVIPGEKRFDLPRIRDFCSGKGIALFDTAVAVRRLMDNASDKFLEVVEPTDIPALLSRMPACGALVTTGQKATDVVMERFGCVEPPVGQNTLIAFDDRELAFWRMPSTSRAYPLPLEKKAASYRILFDSLGMLCP